MKATVEGGLLDRILKTPVGATCTISPAERQGIADALNGARREFGAEPVGDAAILEQIQLGQPITFLGRTLLVA